MFLHLSAGWTCGLQTCVVIRRAGGRVTRWAGRPVTRRADGRIMRREKGCTSGLAFERKNGFGGRAWEEMDDLDGWRLYANRLAKGWFGEWVYECASEQGGRTKPTDGTYSNMSYPTLSYKPSYSTFPSCFVFGHSIFNQVIYSLTMKTNTLALTVI